jgi:glycosyltransferase involved in cell wall biosynthesis
MSLGFGPKSCEMKVLHVTKTRAGGAGVAAERTVAALRAVRTDAELWTEGSAPGLGPASGTLRRWLLDRWDSVPTRRYRRRRFSSWSNNWRQTHLAAAINAAAPDIVHLHWIAQGLMSLSELGALRAPIVWTMHDTWPFTGGCHYPNDCVRYEIGCGTCPQLASQDSFDLSAANHKAKQAVSAVTTWIAPSEWLAGCARRSVLIAASPLRVIPNAIEFDRWKPVPMSEARRAVGLPDDALVLVAGAMDLREPRKGGAFLIPAVDRITTSARRPVVLLLFGGGRMTNRGSGGFEVRQLGPVGDERKLAQLYSAADAMLMPSLQDNLSCVVMEAQACGCPVVGFDAGGTRELILRNRTGLLTLDKTAEGLARAVVEWQQLAVPRGDVLATWREHAASRYAPSIHAAALLREYEAVLASRRE